jgi:hypothetical protein
VERIFILRGGQKSLDGGLACASTGWKACASENFPSSIAPPADFSDRRMDRGLQGRKILPWQGYLTKLAQPNKIILYKH